MLLRPALFSLLPLITLAHAAFAQAPPPQASPSSPVVTVTVTAAGVRFAALGAVRQTRLEVYDSSGARVFDSDFRAGNVRDWSPQGLADGRYACALTARGLDGRLTLRQGAVLVQGGAASLELSGDGGGDAEARGAAEGEETDGPGAATLATHDGRDGAVTSTSGALTLRTGDILSGADREHVRVTEEGRVGVGTKEPEAALDVAGDIRASGFVRAQGGIRFSDGTTLDAAGGRLSLTSAGGDLLTAASAAGTGTLGRLAKWAETGGQGTLTDSLLSESGQTVRHNGNFFQMTGTPTAQVESNIIHLDSSTKTMGQVAGPGTFFGGQNGSYFILRGNTYSAIAGQRGLAIFSSGSVASPVGREGSVQFNTLDQVRMLITPAGNVGIGLGLNGIPQSMLEVGGAVRFAGFRTESNATSPNVVGGLSGNAVLAGVVGATIGGGGETAATNRVTDNFGTVGGGRTNQAGDNAGTTSDRAFATVGGGAGNFATGHSSTIGGGGSNSASGETSTVGGGGGNGAFGSFSTIGGGSNNHATSSSSTIGGGSTNTASGLGSTVPGGQTNTAAGDFSFAAGRGARANHHGAFVWADSTNVFPNVLFASTADNQFLIHASGGVGVGTNAPSARLTVAGSGIFAAPGAARVDLTNTAAPATFSQFVTDGGAWQLNAGGSARLAVSATGNVGVNTSSPADSLHVGGIIRVTQLGVAGSTQLCHNASSQIATCSSSRRYKTDVRGYAPGLELLSRLRPVSFRWKSGGQSDLGFVAEEVAAAEPLLTTRNERGEVEGVKYDRLTAVLVNAVREQQQMIEQLRREVAALRGRGARPKGSSPKKR